MSSLSQSYTTVCRLELDATYLRFLLDVQEKHKLDTLADAVRYCIRKEVSE